MPSAIEISIMISLLLLLAILPAFNAQHILIPPPGDNGTDIGFLIVPGAYLKPVQYDMLARKIQGKSVFRMWVGVVGDFLMDTPNPLQLTSKIDATLEKMHEQGLPKNAPLAIAGHSLGGVFLPSHVKSYPDRYAATLMFASYLPEGDLYSFPTPIMHLSGDMDGQTRITRILPTFKELLSFVTAQNETGLINRPVIIMPGVNHGQFASAPLPSTVMNNDIPAEVDNMTAWESIGEMTDLFLRTHITPGGDAQAAIVLRMAHENAKKIFQPLMDASELDAEDTFSRTVLMGQTLILNGLAPNTSITIDDHLETSLLSIIGAKPTITGNEKNVTVHTFSYLSQPFNPIDVSLDPVTTSEVFAKMKRRSAVAKALGLPDDGQESSCADINKLIMQRAESLASPVSLARCNKTGRQVVYQADKQSSMGPTWIASGLDLDYAAPEGLSVRSAALITDPNYWIPSVAGMHYCKLLSMARAIEWIYIDCLKPRKS